MTLKSVPSHPRDREANLAGLLQQLDAGESALLLSAAADIALVINPDGTLSERVFAGPDLPAELLASWPGKAWTDVSTIESRPKIEQMLQEAAMGLPPRWRQINHQQPDGADIPVRYSVMKAGSGGQFVAMGRDLRQVATVQAVDEVVTLRISKDLFFRLVTEFPQMAVEIMRVLAQRLEKTTADLRVVTGKLHSAGST